MESKGYVGLCDCLSADSPTFYSPFPLTKSILELFRAQSLELPPHYGASGYISAIHLPPRVPDAQPMGNEWIPPITAAHWWNGLQQITLTQWQKMTRARWSLRTGGLGAGSPSPPPLSPPPYLFFYCSFATQPPGCSSPLDPSAKKKREIVGWELYFASGYPEREREERKRERAGLGEEQVDWVTALVNTGKCQAPVLCFVGWIASPLIICSVNELIYYGIMCLATVVLTVFVQTEV
jgi:hypothetical protein